MKQFKEIKESINREVFSIVSSKQCIISTTIVGSFIGSKGIEGISDIDIVIIVEKLTQTIFEDINNSFQQIKSSQIGLDDFDIFINNTFGPLKFNNRKNIVFHLMIYDIEGHIDHVEQSPFTCYSWESFNPIQGISLREVYPVLNLQIKDILESRRGILSYLRDIDNGIITYRKYSFRKGKTITLKDKLKLDLKHRIEYSYHITYNLLNNFYKIISREQRSLKDHEIISFYSKFETFPNHNIQFFKELFLWKRKGSSSPLNEMDKIKLFINDFFSLVEIFKSTGKITSFRRHQITELNDGKFLGVNRDPSITKISKTISDFEYQIGYCSQLKRSKETFLGYYTTEIIESSLLNEIDYGLAEGLDIDQLNYKFPEITSSWEMEEDPKFPEGECQNDVLIRVREFLTKSLQSDKNCLVITHLVVLRMVMFYYLNLDFKNLYKIRIEHLEGFDILNYKNYRSIEIENETRKSIRKQLSIKND